MLNSTKNQPTCTLVCLMSVYEIYAQPNDCHPNTPLQVPLNILPMDYIRKT